MKATTQAVKQTNGKRQKILEAAEEIFAARGYTGARTSEIARRAGIAEGTLYLYFSSREDLFLSLFDERWHAFTEKIRARTDRIADPNDRLKAIFSSAIKLFYSNRSLARIFLIETGPGSIFVNSRVTHRLADFLDLIEEILIDGKKAGKYNKKLDTKVARMVIFGAVQGILTAWLLGDSSPADVRKRFKFSLLKASQTVKIILKSGLTAEAS